MPTPIINKEPHTGRYQKENNGLVNVADIIEAVFDQPSGALKIKKDIITHTFHNAATQAANGNALTVGEYKTLTVKITGTSSSRTITFYAKDPDGNLTALMGVRLSDLATGTSTTGTGEYWQFDVTGVEAVVMDLTAVAGGNVSVTGKAVV